VKTTMDKARDAFRHRCQADFNKRLRGKIIHGVTLAENGDGHFTIILTLGANKMTTDVVVEVLRDPEGNGPGWLDVRDP